MALKKQGIQAVFKIRELAVGLKNLTICCMDQDQPAALFQEEDLLKRDAKYPLLIGNRQEFVF